MLVACGGEQPPPPPDNMGVLGPDTTIVGDDELTSLTGVTEAGVYTFSGPPPTIAALAPGDVLLIGVSALTPVGGVRLVDQVIAGAGSLDVHTSPAALEDAFEELSVSGDYTSQAVADGIRTLDGSPPILSPAQAGITFPIDISVSGGGGNARLQGSLGVAPSVALNVDIDIIAFELEELSLEFGADETFEAALTGSGSFGFDESVELARIPFATILIPVYVPGVGVITVPVTPTVILEAGMVGNLQGQFEASVVQRAGFTSKVGFVNDEWGATSDSDSDFDFDVPVATASLNVKAYGAASLIANIAGIGGPYARAEIYVGLNASADADPPCVRGVLDAGLIGSAGVELLGEGFDTVLFNVKEPLASFDSCDPNAPRPATVWSKSFGRTGSIGENARAVVQAADGTYLVAGDSSLVNGITGAAASVWALRLDEQGNVLWQRAFGLLSGGRVVGAVAQDDGFLLATTLGAVKLDLGGNVRWARRLQGTLEIHSVTQRHEGGVVMAGYFGSTPQAWLVALDAAGGVVWSRTYGPTSFNSVRQTIDGGYVAAGVAPANANDVLVVKVAGDGGVQWSTLVNNKADPSGGENPEPTILDTTDTGLDVIQRADGSFLVVGETYGAFPVPEPSQPGHYAVFVADLSASGDLVGDPQVHRATAEAYYSMGYAVALRTNGSSVIVGRYAEEATDLLSSEKVLLIQGSAYAVLGGSDNTSVLGGLLGGGVGSMPLAATADGGVILVATSDSLGSNNELWVTKFGRTLFIDSPYVDNTGGESYANDKAVQSFTFASATNAPVSATAISPSVEVTAYTVRNLVP
ncbi:MAG TPA: hypothetical protein VFN03_02100 [Trueperaceae bacterium]|nr:hypothetical protein [Trueperaceae bacterium]